MDIFRNRVAFFFALAAMLGFTPAVFAAGPFAPNETVDPDCIPSDITCIVDPGWNVDIASGYVYTGTSPENYLVGIGTATPGAQLDVVGDIAGAVTDTVVSNDGTHNAFDFSTNLSSATGDIDQTNYRGISSSLTWSGSDSYDGVSIDPQSLVSMYGSAVNSGTGIVDSMTAVVGRTINSSTGAINDASAGLFQMINIGNGDVSVGEGFESAVNNLGNGSITDAKAARSTITNSGPGLIGTAHGTASSVVNSSSGMITEGTGVTTEVRNSGAGSIATAYSMDNKIKALAGSISKAVGLRFDIYSANTGNIGDAIGIDFVAANQITDGLQPSIEGSGDAYGIRIDATTGTPGVSAGVDAYGLYIGADSVSGGVNSFGIFVDDGGVMQNFLGSGVRIGTNDNDHLIDDDSNGGASATLFIGNETIDTSVSDRRLKTNIENAQGSALSFLDDFRVVQFDWLPENERSQYGTVPFGLIAQEVEETAPGFVKKPDDPSSYMSVRFADLVPSLIKAIQELQQQISSLTTDAIGNIQDLIVQTISGHHAQFDELCVGSTCVDEATFAQVVAQIQGSEGQSSEDENADNQVVAEDTLDEGDAPTDETVIEDAPIEPQDAPTEPAPEQPVSEESPIDAPTEEAPAA